MYDIYNGSEVYIKDSTDLFIKLYMGLLTISCIKITENTIIHYNIVDN